MNGETAVLPVAPKRPLWRRVVALPSSALGWVSVGCVVLMLFLFGLLRFLAHVRPGPRPTFFSDPLMASVLIAMGIAGNASGIVAIVAMLRRRERSILMLGVLSLWIFVLIFTAGELAGH